MANGSNSTRDEAIRAIVRAWVVPGQRGAAYHKTAKANLKRQWPALANAIESLVEIEALGNSRPTRNR